MERVNAVIIGGGIMGVSLLYHLVKEGWTDVVLLEKSGLTHGSTWHAAGLCTHFAHSLTIQQMRARSVQLYRDVLPAEVGRDVGFHACGALRITRCQDRMDEFAHVAGQSKFNGFELRLVLPEEISALHPLTNTDGLIGGIHEPDDGHVDPTLATNAMAEVARRLGGDIRFPTRVVGTRIHGDRWHVQTESGEIISNNLINAAGTWAWETGQMMGAETPCVPILHQYLVLDRISAVQHHMANTGRELPMIRDPEESWYVRQEGGGLILGPYEREAKTWSVDGIPPDFAAELLPSDLERVEGIVDRAMARVPALAEGGLASVVNGPITFTPDANPLVGPAPGLTNAWMICGSSMGVMEGGGAGWFLASWMTHGYPPFDALAVDPRRFGKWVDRDYRVKKAKECFGLQFGIHYPNEERPAGRQKRLSSLNDHLIARGAVFGAANGWERPNWFATAGSGDIELSFRRHDWLDEVAGEIDRVTNAAGIIDLSCLSKFEIRGSEAGAYMDCLGANSPPAPGRAKLIHVLTHNGGVESEFLAVCLDPETYQLTSAAAAEEIDESLLRRHGRNFDVEVQNVTDRIGTIAIAGPQSRAILEEVSGCGLSNTECGWMSARWINLAGVRCVLLRASYSGELGWELHAPSSDMRSVFEMLFEAGESRGLGCFGAYALDSMRLEKGYPAWGVDLTTERTPWESGLDNFVKCEGRSFRGKEALVAQRRELRWTMRLLEIQSPEINPFHGHAVYGSGKPVGLVTSGGFGHRTGKRLALAYLKTEALASSLEVDILGQRHHSEILERPPFDPDNIRVSS